MATEGISFGSLSTSGGVTRFTGASSEIDTGALVDSLVEARRLPAVRLEAKITKNEAKVAAYDELKGLLQDLKSAVASLRNPPGLLGVRENLFERKEVFYSADTTTSPATLLNVSAANEVPAGKFEVVVEQLAAARKFSSGSTAAAADQTFAQAFNGGAAFSGSFTLGLAGGASATIAVTGDMDIHDLKGAINAQGAAAGVTASVVKVADGDHRLVVTARETGREVVLSPAGGDDVLAFTGLSSDGGATFGRPLAEPREARVRIDGVQVTRPGNRIDDAIGGVTLDLFKAEPGTTITVEVERSLSGLKEQVQGFADAYNALRDFVTARAGVSAGGEVGEEAVLFGDPLLRGLAQGLGGLVSAPVAGLGSGTSAASLAGIGLKLDGDNRLTLDGTTLDAKLLGDLDAVRNVLEFRFTAASPELGVFARTNALADSSFTVDVVDADADGVPESASADGVALDVVGGRLVGRDSTAYEGLEMIWTGQGSASIGVTATQGVADRVYNMLDSALDDLHGTLSKGRQALGERNTDYRAEIEQIEARAERYRQQLVERFSAMETALSIAKSMLEQVRAQVGAFSQGS